MTINENIGYEFILVELGLVHPNTVNFEIEDINVEITIVVGSSIGGGSVIITEINGFNVQFTGEYYTIITPHKDVKGVISSVARILSDENINIATMVVSRNTKGKEASMIVEIDSIASDNLIDKIKALEPMISVIKINPVKEGETNV
ncbi:ACT domain-containing protein [Romboutsia sp.]|uniref:ACT domain-containing protein n=1 Tax=Romboutsia sp. TaxID=1965302 RepID=UPI003F38C120